ncbi:MAG: hypothetical protein AAB415_00875 [Patescibacteria group bacterium]
MSITERLNKIKPVILPLNLVLIGTLGFGLGRYTRIEEAKVPVMIEQTTSTTASGTSVTASPKEASETIEAKSAGTLVGSKNGTKYHYPWCGGASRIKEENKVWFASKEEALSRGYTPAANCPGLK